MTSALTDAIRLWGFALGSIPLVAPAAGAPLPASPEVSDPVHGRNPWAGTARITEHRGGSADTLYVDRSAAPGGDGLSWQGAFNDLQIALALAELHPNVSEIRVAAGTYLPDAGTGDRTTEFRLIGSSNLRLLGGYPSGGGEVRDPATNETVLSGDLARDDLVSFDPDQGLTFLNIDDNCFRVLGLSGAQSDVEVDGFTIKGGHNLQRGGGVAASASNAKLRNVRVSECSALLSGGGAFVATGSNISLAGCIFERNRSSVGGGLHARDSAVDTAGSSFVENEAELGGGVYLVGVPETQPPLIATAFEFNIAYEDGGGLLQVGDEATLTLDACRFTANKATAGGGARIEGKLHASACVWESNTVSVRGGGLFADMGGTLETCVFTDNQSADDGGGAEIARNWSVAGCEFSDNSAAGRGGGLYASSCSGVIENTRFLRNDAGLDGGIFYSQEGLPYPQHPVNILRNIDLIGNTAGEYAGGTIAGNLSSRVRVEHVRVEGNEATGDVGGLAIGQACDVLDSVFIGNSAGGRAGAAFVLDESSSRSALLQRCRFEGNTAGADAGAVLSGTMTRMRDCVFTGNSATDGGAIAGRTNRAKVVATGLSFIGNTASREGGAIYFTELDLSVCLFVGNIASSRGGAAAEIDGLIDASTIVQNNASTTGGVIAAQSTSITNSILWGNTGAGAAEGRQVGGSGLTASYSIIEGLAFTQGPQNSGADPIFADFDGPDGVPATGDEDFHLNAGSPGIDTADRAEAQIYIGGATDIVGAPRFASLGDFLPATMDRGAFETQDCDADGVPDHEATLSGIADDCNVNGIPDCCETGSDRFSTRVTTVEPESSYSSPTAIVGDADSLFVGMDREAHENGTGAVYVYEREGASWRQAQRIIPELFESGFGMQLVRAGDLAVASNTTSSFSQEPRATLLRRSGENWSIEHIFDPPEGAEDSGFASSVAISKGEIYIGAPRHNDDGTVFVYREVDGAWTLVDELVSPSPRDRFGERMVADDNTLVVMDEGFRVRFYSRTPDGFEHDQMLNSALLGPIDQPRELCFSGDLVFVANPDASIGNGRGSVGTIRRDAGGWAWLPMDLPQDLPGTFSDTLYDFGIGIGASAGRVAINATVVVNSRLTPILLFFRLDGDTWVYEGRAYHPQEGVGAFTVNFGVEVGPDYVSAVALINDESGLSSPGFVTYFQQSPDADSNGIPDECGPDCGVADLADPFGTLDLADISAFVTLFQDGDSGADLDTSGTLDLDDITLFVASFVGGCG